jgi:uncharacterized membrane protein/thiol-disulfide isomerase/thioredoxin
MNFLKRIIFPVQNCEEIAIEFCKHLELKVTETTIKEDILQHPNYPSLLSISDVLKNIKVDNISLKTTAENLINLPQPLIVQIYGKSYQDSLFAIISKIDADNVEWYNPEVHKKVNISFEDFTKKFTGYALIAESNETSEEQNYKLKLKRERTTNFWNTILVLSFPILLIIWSSLAFINHGLSVSFAPVLYTLLTFIGALIGGLLLLYEVDQHIPIFQKVCPTSRKINCVAILNSKASKIFGITWSSIGFTYFVGIFLALLFGGIINDSFLFVTAWINVLALPCVIYSIYYQRSVAKEWCPMCLLVQLLLVLQFITAFTGRFHVRSSIYNLDSNVIMTFALCFIIVFIVVQILIPTLKKTKVVNSIRMELKRLKHNPQVFESLLSIQKQITKPLDVLGITFGNPEGKIHVIKVCNLYCVPCAKSHPIFEELVSNNNNICVQVIFKASPDKDDYRNLPLKHFLNIDRNNDKKTLHQALNDWYLAEFKDYDAFNRKYPIEKNIDFTSEIKAMSDWCENVDISFTPTFFINNKQLPEIYDVSDLKYFLSI